MSDPKPADQAIRDRFIHEVDRNFSVIAPAGVGKTAAIADRVTSLATRSKAPARILPKLVVVTYTNRAADEMRQRARNNILQNPKGPEILNHFNRAFFGTIHSYCLKLLQTYGHYLGLPAALDQVADEERLWREFVRQHNDAGAPLSGDELNRLFRHVSTIDVMELARKVPPADSRVETPGPVPQLDFQAIFEAAPNNRSKGGVEAGQDLLREWLREFESGEGFLPLPVYEKGGAAFRDLWKETFQPLREWLGEAALIVASRIALRFRDYRLQHGLLTFDDQVRLAVELMKHPIAGRKIRAEGFRVILDEAQDTDPAQFQLLLEIARPEDAEGLWPETLDAPPLPGCFSMVGDPQQSIYGERADLAFYLEIEKKLEECGAAETLTFETTFRCDQTIVDAVNRMAPAMLHGEDGQVDFVHLQARPDVLSGQTVRVHVPKNPSWEQSEGKPDVTAREGYEARHLADWLHRQSLRTLQADRWSEVAILCPRKRWFRPLDRALRQKGYRTQIQSTRDIMGDSIAFAWFTALLAVLADPCDGFEIVGVLREVFGISDQALYEFSKQDGRKFQILESSTGRSVVARKLNDLHELRQLALRTPLREAVAAILEKTRLRERIQSLPPAFNQGEGEILDALLIRTSEAEAQGLGLNEWAGQLCREFNQPVPGEAVEPDAIQLITCQKAKGLQWRAVIIPFFFREIRDRPAEYPDCFFHLFGEKPMAYFEKAGIPEDIEALRERHRQQELQRILYVAMTRAQHTLVLLDDSDVFPKSKRSFATLLSLDAKINRAAWKELPTRLRPEAAGEEPGAPQAISSPRGFPVVDETVLKSARASADRFLRRKLPHSLASYASADDPERRRETDFEPALLARERAIDYGIWWHDFCEHLPWRAGIERWRESFDANVVDCPDPERARREWRQFLESDLAVLLKNPGVKIHTELPVLWKSDQQTCLEGLIDLAAFDPGQKSWLIVDWKTDQVAPTEFNTLMENYRPQISAYLEALTNLTQFAAQAGLYSTVTGKWLRIYTNDQVFLVKPGDF